MTMPGVGSVNTVGSVNSLLSSQAGAPFNELARQGTIWTVQTTTAFAPLTAVPTTTTRLEVFNNTGASGLSAVTFEVLDVFTFQLLSTAATQTYSIWAEVVGEAAPTSTVLSVFSHNGRQSYSSGPGAKVITGVGTTVVAGGWRPWGPPQAWGTAAATPGNAWSSEVHGKLLIPPGTALHLQVVGSIATAASFNALGVSFAEVAQTTVQ